MAIHLYYASKKAELLYIYFQKKKITKKGKFSSPFFSLISLTSATTMEKKEENKGI